jgi:hypothetical protein
MQEGVGVHPQVYLDLSQKNKKGELIVLYSASSTGRYYHIMATEVLL